MASTKRFSGPALVEAIQSYMDTMEAKYRRAFMTLIDAVSGSPELAEIVRDIGAGTELSISPRTYQAIENLNIDTTTLKNIARQAMSGGGRITAKAVGLEGAFNVTNPRAIAYARTLSAESIVGISRTVRKTIREIIAEAIEDGSTPAEVARRIKNEIGLTPQYAGAVRNYRKKLLASGKSAKEANTLSQKYAERLLRKRAQTIARTEIAMATNAGQHEFWRQMRDNGAIPVTAMRMWITAKDEKTCAICGPMDGQLAPIDGVWSGVYSEAHAHPNCRCTSGLVFDSKVKKYDPLAWEHWLLSQGKTPSQIVKHAQHNQKDHGRRGGRVLTNASESGGTFQGSSRFSGAPFRLEGEEGSYYDYVDWDDPDYHPVEQMLDMAAESLPIKGTISIVGPKNGWEWNDVDPELLAESLDSLQAISEMFPGVTLGDITYTTDLGAGVGGSALGFSFPGADGSIKLNFTSIAKGEMTTNFIRSYEMSRDSGWHVPSDVSVTQKTVVHEFGHVVRYAMMRRAEGVKAAYKIEKDTLSAIDPDFKVGFTAATVSTGAWAKLPFGTDNQPGMYLGDTRYANITEVGSSRVLGDRRDLVTVGVSQYASKNGHELWAELFAEAYTNDYSNLRVSARAFYDAMDKHWDKAGIS